MLCIHQESWQYTAKRQRLCLLCYKCHRIQWNYVQWRSTHRHEFLPAVLQWSQCHRVITKTPTQLTQLLNLRIQLLTIRFIFRLSEYLHSTMHHQYHEDMIFHLGSLMPLLFYHHYQHCHCHHNHCFQFLFNRSMFPKLICINQLHSRPIPNKFSISTPSPYTWLQSPSYPWVEVTALHLSSFTRVTFFNP